MRGNGAGDGSVRLLSCVCVREGSPCGVYTAPCARYLSCNRPHHNQAGLDDILLMLQNQGIHLSAVSAWSGPRDLHLTFVLLV